MNISRNFLRLTLVLSVGLAVVDSAEAQRRRRGGRGSGQLFTKFDKNKDGKLTKAEVPAKLWARISKADANKDGSVTKDELAKARKGRKGRRRGGRGGRGGGQLFTKFDKNKDGKLTKTEVPANLWARISKADANKDGAVTKEELAGARKGGKKKKKGGN